MRSLSDYLAVELVLVLVMHIYLDTSQTCVKYVGSHIRTGNIQENLENIKTVLPFTSHLQAVY